MVKTEMTSGNEKLALMRIRMMTYIFKNLKLQDEAGEPSGVWYQLNGIRYKGHAFMPRPKIFPDAG
jgi:hypothetical protein